MPMEAISFEDDHLPTVSISKLTAAPWRTYDGKSITFPEVEDPGHIKLVRDTLPLRLSHLEGFFLKKASTRLPPSRPGHDVVLELAKPLEGKSASYWTPLAYLPLEKETTDELLRIDFISPCMEEQAASVFFAPKPHTSEKRFCVDYR